MKKLAAIAAILLMLGGAAAQSSNLPDAGITSDSLFFGLDRAYESLSLALASGDAKAEMRLKFAEERLSEAQKLKDSNKSTAADRTMEMYHNQMKKAGNSSEVESSRNRHESIVSKLERRSEQSESAGNPGAGFMATGRVVQKN